MIVDAKSHEEDDVHKKDMAELRNNADGLIYTTELSLKEYRRMIQENEAVEIQRDLEECKRLLQSSDTVALRRALDRLEKSAHRMAEVIYSEAGAGRTHREDEPQE